MQSFANGTNGVYTNADRGAEQPRDERASAFDEFPNRETEAIDKVPQKLDRTDFEAHLQDDARHLTFSDKDTLSQVSQKLDREEF